MRAPSSLPALLAAAACSLSAAVLAPLAAPAAAAGGVRWLRPVPGDVVRSFTYERSTPFLAGAHRGVDLDAPPGALVRAACSGPVVHASEVAGRALVVSMDCGAHRVSFLPLATIAVRAGGRVRAGATIGTVASGHGGLHVGVRRAADPFAYVDPMTRFATPERPFAPAPRPAVPRFVPRLAPPLVPRLPPRFVPRLAPRATLRRPDSPVPATNPHATPRPAPLAPWTVWAGLALALCGAAGSGTVAVRRRSRAPADVRTTATA